ncbi:hypothetical protein OKA05_04900 [Luteolibacter arcticus]|uniref:Uncharacterized protein n=1 Tax=Luteolibacter arcticus TaxID=1581411 RepID=A0ABT3GE39_9BACT|nr:hypothetical protein [Luteolibacter arcticus]MCW1921878.1 hypothetical protein [Luteolibacter arcticus]
MIVCEHAPGTSGWYDDLEAELLNSGVPVVTESFLTREVERIMKESGTSILPDRGRAEKALRASGLLPEGMALEQWMTAKRPLAESAHQDLFEGESGLRKAS